MLLVARNVPLYTVYTMNKISSMYRVYIMYKVFVMYKVYIMYRVYTTKMVSNKKCRVFVEKLDTS